LKRYELLPEPPPAPNPGGSEVKILQDIALRAFQKEGLKPFGITEKEASARGYISLLQISEPLTLREAIYIPNPSP